MKKYLNITLSSIALITALILVGAHFEYGSNLAIVFASIALIAGYYFGRWTCHLHARKSGFWITILIFISLNLLHSMIDGASIGDIHSFSQAVAVLSHEFARQPALYVILWGMLTPFMLHIRSRIFIVPVAVSGVWLLGIFLGQELLTGINTVSWLEPLADQALFLFIGDIIHHIIEEYRKLNSNKFCCHT